MNSDDDGSLVERAQAGDTAAFEELVRRHQQFAYHVALRALGRPQDAEDVTQEAFLRAWEGLPGFRRQAQFQTWLYRIVINLCYNRRPRLRREYNSIDDGSGRFSLVDENFQRDPDEYLEGKELFNFLHDQLDLLPENYRLMMLLRFREGCSYADIADILDVPLGTVKTGIYRARERLKAAVKREQREWVLL